MRPLGASLKELGRPCSSHGGQVGNGQQPPRSVAMSAVSVCGLVCWNKKTSRPCQCPIFELWAAHSLYRWGRRFGGSA